jgi:phosphoglycolate phosphatase-like HAD superfamily hydrolase
MTKSIVLFDLDGTIADNSHRLHYFDRSTMNWDEYEEQCIYDPPFESTITMMKALKFVNKQVWIWTGRSDHVIKETQTWLHRMNVPYDQLIMRPTLDSTPNAMLKLRWLLESPVPLDRVICAYDDDVRVAKALSEHIPVYHFIPDEQ